MAMTALCAMGHTAQLTTVKLYIEALSFLKGLKGLLEKDHNYVFQIPPSQLLAVI